MSLPSFPVVDPPIQREDAVNQILSSIAMEELGMSHILNAEGEKLQYILGTLPGLSGPAATVGDVLAANESVRGLLETAVQNQLFLKAKMQGALEASPMQGPTGPTGPTGPLIYAQQSLLLGDRSLSLLYRGLSIYRRKNVVIVLDVIKYALILVGKIEVHRYFPVLMHPNRINQFHHDAAIKGLNVPVL